MRKKTINHYQYYKQKRINQELVINKRLYLLISFIIIGMTFLIIGLYNVQVLEHEYYSKKAIELTQTIIEGESTPRGRIYDRNGVLIVDNVAVKKIVYKKQTGTTTAEEISLAYKLANLIEVDYKELSTKDLKIFWLKNNSSLANKKITNDEWILYDERKLTDNDIYNLKLERITEDELSSYTDLDKEAAYIYHLMTTGYYYAEKTIKKDDLTDAEYAIVAEHLSELKGFSTKLDWERYYPYGDTFRSVLGSVSSSEKGIPYEYKDLYLSLGYALTDRVGTSYLEQQYESILKGTKSKYLVKGFNEYELIEEGSRGNDIVLTIDIKLQKEVEKVLEKELINARKNDKYTENLTTAFAIIQDPNTGEILAMAGKQIVKEKGKYKVYDYDVGAINATVTPGSSVKAASHTVGYVTGNLKIGEVRNDTCIKIAATPEKCSFRNYGNIDDVQALKYSSNVYQFHTAIKVGKGKYSYNGPLTIDKKAFSTYRKIFGEYGLGVKTGIDLPNEFEGYKGTGTASGLLLDFAIGQYDNYTPIQLSQYISTVANGGNRMKPYLLKSVYKPTKTKLTDLVYSTEPIILNKVNIEEKYLNRIKKGLRMVFEPGGTASGHINNKYEPAGKTGTSESFVDTDGDGIIDKETLSTVLVAYAPYDDPVVSFTVVTPNVATGDVSYGQMSKVNTRISKKISQKYFEIYK